MAKYQEQQFTNNSPIKVWKKIFEVIEEKRKYIYMLGLLAFLCALGDVIFPLFSKYAIDNFIVQKTTDGIGVFAIVFFAIILAQGITIYMWVYIGSHIEHGTQQKCRKATFEKLQKLSMAYYNQNATGWIVSRVMSDTKKLSMALSSNLADVSWMILLIIFNAIAMLLLNWQLALIVLVSVPLMFVISFYFQRKIMLKYREMRKVNSEITNSFNEAISGAQTIKTLVSEQKFKEEFTLKTDAMRCSAIKAAVLNSFFIPLTTVLGSLTTAIIIAFGGFYVFEDYIELGTLVALVSYSTGFFEPIKNFARIFMEMQFAQASAERLVSMLDADEEVKDRPEVIEKYGDVLNPKKELWPPVYGNVEFKNVDFAYSDEPNVKILNNFNLKVEKGETIAIVGETGAGKTTIVNLVARFFEPTNGKIIIDDVDYVQMPMLWLQSNIGYVLQEPHLFSGTILDNIKYSRQDATDDEVVKAAKIVQAHDFIVNLEKGYETDVGEGGGHLSQGQRQLISFARAILNDPKIIILDEATSSVDTQTEQAINVAIENVLKDRTSFLIAHRLSTIRNADRIIVLSAGEIVEIGSHDELLDKKGAYYKLYNNQFLKERYTVT